MAGEDLPSGSGALCRRLGVWLDQKGRGDAGPFSLAPGAGMHFPTPTPGLGLAPPLGFQAFKLTLSTTPSVPLVLKPSSPG